MQHLRYMATIGSPGSKVHRQGCRYFRLTAIETKPGQIGAVRLGPECGFIRVEVGRSHPDSSGQGLQSLQSCCFTIEHGAEELLTGRRGTPGDEEGNTAQVARDDVALFPNKIPQLRWC